MSMPDGPRPAGTRLIIARHAAYLFWENGFDETSGEDIASAAGLSSRTLWRYFTTKESCVEPLYREYVRQAINTYTRWPDEESLEDFLQREFRAFALTPEEFLDNHRALRMVALSLTQPALRGPWLVACGELEQGFRPMVARRIRGDVDDFDVRLRTAGMTAAFRVICEELSPGVARGEHQDREETARWIAHSIRTASGDHFCDPVVENA